MPLDIFSEKFSGKNYRILRVTELNFAIKQLLETEVPLLWVQGEISNLVKAASGHFYFSLKDDQAQVRCVMFRHKSTLLSNPLNNGQQVEVLAIATLYEQRGDFQLTVEQVRPAGLGVLYEQFTRLRQRLEKEGLFAAERKRTLPAFPTRVGIITSPQAAALRDVLAVLRLRLPAIPVVLYPVPVQGGGSAEKITEAILLANRRKECDVLIVCRGGGSIEDLWAFNEEIVARAIDASMIPVISGIGHETDFTIADFVADERAPTPTAAAQRAVPDRTVLLNGLRVMAQHIGRAQGYRLQNIMQTVDYLQCRLVHPAQQLQHRAQRLDQIQQRLRRALSDCIRQYDWQWQVLVRRLCAAGKELAKLHDRHDMLGRQLVRAARSGQTYRSIRVDSLAQHLTLLDPGRVLARGYSMVRDMDGHIVANAGQLSTGDRLEIVFAQGWARAEIKESGES